MAHKETRQLLARIKDAGWTVEKLDGSGHWRAFPPVGGEEGYVTIPDTPSDSRSLKNTRAHLKKLGLDLSADPNVVKREARKARMKLRQQEREERIDKAVEAVQPTPTRPPVTIERAKAMVETSNKKGGRKFSDVPVQWVLRLMASEPTTSFTSGDLVQILPYHKTTITTVCKYLVEQDFIKLVGRGRHAHDKRVANVFQVSPTGLEHWRAFVEANPKEETVTEPFPTVAPDAPVAPPAPVVEVVAPTDPTGVIAQLLVEAVGTADQSVVDALVTILTWIKTPGDGS